MSIQVSDFKHIPGENDAEYIKLLQEHVDRQNSIIRKAVAKLKIGCTGMGVYIPGMEMPGICAKCPFFTERRDHGICDLTHIEMFFIEKIISMRHEKCPLIEVPEPNRPIQGAENGR